MVCALLPSFRHVVGLYKARVVHITSQSLNSSPRLLYFPLSILRNYPVRSNLDAFQGSRLRSRVSHHPNQDHGQLLDWSTSRLDPSVPSYRRLIHARRLVVAVDCLSRFSFVPGLDLAAKRADAQSTGLLATKRTTWLPPVRTICLEPQLNTSSTGTPSLGREPEHQSRNLVILFSPPSGPFATPLARPFAVACAWPARSSSLLKSLHRLFVLLVFSLAPLRISHRGIFSRRNKDESSPLAFTHTSSENLRLPDSA